MLSTKGTLFATRNGTVKLAAAGLAFLTAVSAGRLSGSQEAAPAEGMASFATDSRIVVTPEGIDRLLFPRPPVEWNPAVARFRGGTDLYAKVAPAVVVVRTASGHGTGFLISQDGWIVTNHHVISQGLMHDPARQASYATAYIGKLGPDGTMGLTNSPSRAYLYRADPARDLALLKLEPAPSGLPFLPLAPTPPRPGMNVSMVGHPAAGMLWSLRSGLISAAGRAPTDLVDLVMTRLQAASSQRTDLIDAIQRLPSRRIVLSSCGANPGDSGSPLVDDSGQVVAVTFAGPADPTKDKFTYHVHLDELKAFLEPRPNKPMILVPDPWDAGPRAQFLDCDGDGRAETLVLGSERPEMVLFDLSGRTVFPGMRNESDQYTRLVAERGWQFDVAVSLREGASIAMYDTNGDGMIDLVLLGPDPTKADVRMTRSPSRAWTVAAGSGPVVSPALLGDPPRQKRLLVVLQAIKRTQGK